MANLPTVTDDHRIRAQRMIDTGLDNDEVSQWLATHEAEKAEAERLQTRLIAAEKALGDLYADTPTAVLTVVTYYAKYPVAADPVEAANDAANAADEAPTTGSTVR